MIKSMTAFAKGEKAEGSVTVSVEIRSFNSRYLDLILRIPQTYLPLEERIRKMVSEKNARGRVECKVQVRDEFETVCEYEVDENKAAAYYRVLKDLKERFALESPVALDHLTHISGIIKPAEVTVDSEAHWPLIQECVAETLESLDAMRSNEGRILAQDFSKRLDYIESTIRKIADASDGLLPQYQEKLKSRIAALTQGMVEIEPARIAQEAAFLADRSDISEETVRAQSHVQQFRSIMNAEDGAGRKLNFLLQEFNREFNTMGSKCGNADISHIIVEMKSELEKIREQVQNIE